MRTHRELVLDIQRWLADFCLDFKGMISARAYDWLDSMVQSIDHDLQEVDEKAEETAIPMTRTIEARC